MKLATMEDFDEVWSILMQYKNIFPHLRYDYMTRKVTSNETVFDQGVVITFTKYKKKTKLGNISAFGGDYIIHQIAAKNQGDGSAKKIIVDFLNWIDSPKCWLTVRKSNDRAIKFYQKIGFKEVGYIDWNEKGFKLPGVVFLYIK
jgi:RimJ/RimL family protein N-acetyltransferase